MIRRSLFLLTGFGCASVICAVVLPCRSTPKLSVRAAEQAATPISIDYPRTRSIFPPEITAPTFIWHDPSPSAVRWRIEVTFSDGAMPLRFESHGEAPRLGEIDQRCISTTNEVPKLTADQASSHTWRPDAQAWEFIKRHSGGRTASVTISGLAQSGTAGAISVGSTAIETSKDPVGAPIFYRDVPLMPSETEKGIIKPLAEGAVQLIQWRLQHRSHRESRGSVGHPHLRQLPLVFQRRQNHGHGHGRAAQRQGPVCTGSGEAADDHSQRGNGELEPHRGAPVRR